MKQSKVYIDALDAEAFGQCVLQDGQCKEMLLKVSLNTMIHSAMQLWDECLETRLDPDVKGRIIGVQTQITTFDLLFALQLSMKILKITDNLSRTLYRNS